MEEYLRLVKKSPLFHKINDDELYTPLKCYTVEQIACEGSEYILRMGESMNKMTILLRGRVQAMQENFWRRQELICHIKKGELFGESYSCARTPVLPMSVIAEGVCGVLFPNYQRIITFCFLACEFHTKFIHNVLHLVSGHSVKLENRLEHMCRKTTREKPLSYLLEQAVARDGRDFDIPHSRQELAEYFYVGRNAISSELSRMRDEGILDFQKNHFALHDRYDSEHREGV